MREIKFRAWHPEHGGMVYSTLPTLYEKREFYPFGFEVGFSHYPEDGWEVTQYTGLKDKNGKEVYEGDIVSVWRDGSNRIFTVKWREQGVSMYILYPQPLNEDFWHLRSDMEMAWEVIGNIYENPELFSQCK